MKHRRSWWIKAEVVRPQGRTLASVAFQEDKTTDFAFLLSSRSPGSLSESQSLRMFPRLPDLVLPHS